MKIRVCDDETSSADEWVEAIHGALGADHSVERLLEPLAAIQELVDRKVSALEPEKKKFDAESSVCLDDIDILVVDFDLIHIDTGGNRTTGEGVARLAKAYSNCGLVVVLNQYSKVDFDLSMTGHLTSFADVNVDALTVGEPSLWLAASTVDFKPSYWSPLLDVLPARRSCAAASSELDPSNASSAEISTVPESKTSKGASISFDTVLVPIRNARPGGLAKLFLIDRNSRRSLSS